MKRKILIGTIAAVTLLSATTATAFAAKSPAPAPAQVTNARTAPAPVKAGTKAGQLVTLPAAPGKAHAVTGATVQAVSSDGTAHAVPEVVLVRPVKGHAGLALETVPTGTTQAVPAHVKAVPAKK